MERQSAAGENRVLQAAGEDRVLYGKTEYCRGGHSSEREDLVLQGRTEY